MSMIFNITVVSFITWFNLVFQWNTKSTSKSVNTQHLVHNFFLKKKILNYSQEAFVLFYLNFFFKLTLMKTLKMFFSNGFVGLKSIWNHLRFWLSPLFLSILIFLNFIFYKNLPFNKVIFLWTAVFMIFYWLISGFVFFIKKYQYGKYTSSIQRFWKRSYILFWLLETCLLLVFVYLTFTASQESFYMFDQIQVYKTHLFSWRLFILKNIPVIFLISLVYFLILTLKWNTFSKHSIWLLTATFLLTYIIWIEFYQFYHIVNFYGNLNWVYDFDEKVWNLELETRRTRIVNNYVMLLLILRFWHLIFVYIFWLFFVLRGCEIKRLRYPLLAANFQNLIILYIMNWITMYPWFKMTFRKYLNQPYIVFNVNNRSVFLRILFNDSKLFLLNAFDGHFFFLKSYFKKNFFYFIEWNNYFLNQQIRKHYIKNNIITELKSFTTFSPLTRVDSSIHFFFLWWSGLFTLFDKTMNFINVTHLFDAIDLLWKTVVILFNLIKHLFNTLISSINLIFVFFL